MKDLISKAGVLETYAELYDTFEDNQFIRKELNKVYDKLNGLPYAQPEPQEDAVSRKDAIRWVKTECNPYGKPTLDFESGKKVIEHLECMPSITQKQELCDDVVSRQAIIKTLNEMDRYVSEELRLCDTDKKFPKNEVFIVDDVYKEIVENLPSAQTESCEDAVSREAVSKWLKQYGQDVLHGKYKFSLMYIWKNLMDLPSVTPKRKTGQWLDDYQYGYKCSECGAYLEIDCGDVEMNFCPNCAADMRAE